MRPIRDIARKIRSKNAGPFWITVDLFCEDDASYKALCQTLSTAQVAAFFKTTPHEIKRFELDAIRVLKFSLPRPNIQGSREDTDMHGAAYGAKLAELCVA